MTKPDTSRARMDKLQELGCADYLHMALVEERDALTAEVERLREVAEWYEKQRQDAIRRAAISVAEDQEVLHLCKKYGFGAVMDSASRQWIKIDNSGAFFIGGAVGDTSARAALQEKLE